MWTAVVQVVEVHRTQDSNNKRGNQTKIYKWYLLIDEHGMKVSGVLYDNNIQYYSASLKPFKRYRISNAKLTPAFAHFKVGPYEYSWIISNKTPVELVEEPNVPPLPFSYSLCPFNEFIHHADKESGFNIKGIAIHAFRQRQVTAHSTIREIIIIDESKQPIILGLWNSFGDNEGTIIADNIANTPVIIGVNIAQKLRDKTYKQLDLMLPPPTMNETVDVPTAVTTLHTVCTAWVVGQLQFIATNQAYHFSACENCNKKVSAPPGWFLRCSLCDEYAEVQLRCRVPMELTGGNRSLHIVMSSPNIETLTGITAQQLKDSHEFDFDVHRDLQLALDKLHVVRFI